MFDIKALGRNITLKSLDFFTNEETTSTVQVFTRPGSYKGYENSMDGWLLVYNASVAQLGRYEPTSLHGFDSIVIPANSMQSLQIYTQVKVMYRGGTNDTSEGSLF
jgi:hypothetical protein